MSSSVNVFGISAGQWIPGPDFQAAIGTDGKWSGSQTFYCRKFDFSSVPIRTAFIKGARATAVYPNLGAEFNFLTISDVAHEHKPGGITEILVSYEGYSSEWGFDNDETEGSYSLNATMSERSIMEHPDVQALADVSILQEAFDGKMKRDPYKARSASVIYPVAERDLVAPKTSTGSGTDTGITDEDFCKWWVKIIDKGNRTWDASSIEYSYSSTNLGGITQAQMNKLGYIDTPPGNPKTPTNGGVQRNWRCIGLNENRTKSGDTATVSKSINWHLSDPGKTWDADIYTAP